MTAAGLVVAALARGMEAAKRVKRRAKENVIRKCRLSFIESRCLAIILFSNSYCVGNRRVVRDYLEIPS